VPARPEQPASSGVAAHRFFAEAHVLSASLKQPITQEIKSHVSVTLPKVGGYDFRGANSFRLKGIISYQFGYAQVAGQRSLKPDHGFTTMATAAVDGLNVLDVITADRVVGQVSTEHPDYNRGEGQVPSVTFLGTRFDNLQIGGYKVEVERQLDILGPKPAGDRSYFDDPGVLDEISKQYVALSKGKGLPAWASDLYRWDRTETQRTGVMRCSLVRRVIGAPGISFGHVIDLPHFGKIFLGELTVERKKLQTGSGDPDKYAFHLTMIRLELGCLAHGSATIVTTDSNGHGSGGSAPGTHGPGEGQP